ncbi:MAG: ACP S-malonyltransferase [Chloroflexi bacterium]|nr:ACP S-malonyltransferase [Chloroflexota bacterium]
MGRDLHEHSPAARQVFDKVDEALGWRLSHLMFTGPAEELQQTANSQPAILTASLASMAAAKEQADGPAWAQPAFVAGHSLGEYTALVAAGVADLQNTIRLVQERGRLMQEASDRCPGSMVAILGLEESAVLELCRESGTQIANINSPGQIVISGERDKVAEAVKLAHARGAKRAIPLPVNGGFHSYLMGPALEGMQQTLKGVQFREPATPIVANCTARPLGAISEVKAELLQQLCGCVRWQDCITYMANSGVTTFIEFGPGRVLGGLVKRIAPEAQVMSVGDLPSLRRLLNSQ